MPRHYLLDTNIISYLSDPRSPHRESIKRHLFALDDRDDLSVSVVTLYELSYGLHSFQSSEESMQLFRQGIAFIERHLDVLPLGMEEVDIFGQLKARYQQHTGIHTQANKKNDLDFLIAATAIHHQAILVSNDSVFDALTRIEPKLTCASWAN